MIKIVSKKLLVGASVEAEGLTTLHQLRTNHRWKKERKSLRYTHQGLQEHIRHTLSHFILNPVNLGIQELSLGDLAVGIPLGLIHQTCVDPDSISLGDFRGVIDNGPYLRVRSESDDNFTVLVGDSSGGVITEWEMSEFLEPLRWNSAYKQWATGVDSDPLGFYRQLHGDMLELNTSLNTSSTVLGNPLQLCLPPSLLRRLFGRETTLCSQCFVQAPEGVNFVVHSDASITVFLSCPNCSEHREERDKEEGYRPGLPDEPLVYHRLSKWSGLADFADQERWEAVWEDWLRDH